MPRRDTITSIASALSVGQDQITLTPSYPEPVSLIIPETIDEKGVDVTVAEEEDRDPPDSDILTGWKLFLAFVAMLSSMFLVALDGVGLVVVVIGQD